MGVVPFIFLFLPHDPHQGFAMESLFEMAQKIINNRGGDEYKRAWLERWLSDPDHEDEFLSLLLKKEMAEAAKKKKETSKPKKIDL